MEDQDDLLSWVASHPSLSHFLVKPQLVFDVNMMSFKPELAEEFWGVHKEFLESVLEVALNAMSPLDRSSFQSELEDLERRRDAAQKAVAEEKFNSSKSGDSLVLELTPKKRSAEKLFYLVKRGSVVKLGSTLKAYPECKHHRNENGQSLLHVACESQQTIDSVQVLLDGGVDPNIVNDQDGNTPMHTACEFGNYMACIKLIDAGCKLDVANKYGRVPVEVALENGFATVVEMLLEAQTNETENSTTNEGDMALENFDEMEDATTTTTTTTTFGVDSETTISTTTIASSSSTSENVELQSGEEIAREGMMVSPIKMTSASDRITFLKRKMMLAALKVSELELEQARVLINAQQSLISQFNEMHLCKVCMDNVIDTVLLECGHQVVCHHCTDDHSLNTCPICRVSITRVVRVYTA
eukprot:TRINITY_DN270_c2_g1_i2.p1 TRINITY_DN270_c2_g1~~TRINITY_DN270_c2_g1_i2.p1  ORF type:complete len:414 (-),score=140.73 TRINITY_DN270_c2_g1_i2:75-1316(-)